MSRPLPPNPNLEFLRKQAKDLLREMLQQDPASKLTDAQHVLAREYGFASWPKLKAYLESSAKPANPLVGTWIADVSKSRQHPLNPFQSATLTFDVVGDIVTIADVVVDASGHEERSTNTIRADGEERSEIRTDYAVLTRWLSSHVLETVVKKERRSRRKGEIRNFY